MTTILDFEWSDTQLELMGVVQKVTAEYVDWTDYHRLHSKVVVDHSNAWQVLTEEVGIRGLTLTEKDGGSGEPWRTVAALVHALAGSTAAVPVLSQLAMVEALLGRAARPDLIEEYLQGQTIFTVGVPEDQPSHAFAPRVRIEGGFLTGSLQGIPVPAEADAFLLLAEDDGEARIVRAAVDNAVFAPIKGFDEGRPLADVAFEGASFDVVVGDPERALDTWRHGLQVLEVLVAVEQSAITANVLDRAVQYAVERQQFGKAICANQSVRHTLADMWIRAGEAEAAAFYALSCLDSAADDLPVAVGLARSYCGDAARRNAESALQIHGGNGYSWENPLHLELKRAVADALWLDGPAGYRHNVRGLVNL